MAIFEGIGRVGDYAQLRNLRREMKYRIKTGGSLAQAMGAPVQPGRVKPDEAQKMREKSDANREAQIRQKLRQGQKLSPGDKRYLKENNPDLYDKVERIEMRREALERALKNAKSKDEALRAVAQANISVLSEMQKGGGDAPNLSAAGGSSAAGAGASVMTAGGDAAAADALDAPLSEGTDAAPTTGAMQGTIGHEALAAQGSETSAEQPSDAPYGTGARADGVQSDPHKEREHFQPGPSTRDAYGNRRVLSREELDDMLRQAQEAGNLSPLDNEKVYLLRALQRAWMEYANSEEYKNLPNTVLDAAAEEAHGVHRKKRTDDEPVPVRPTPSAAEVLAAHTYYHAARGSEPFEAKG